MPEQFKNQIEIYRAPDGPEVQLKFSGDTVWCTQAQMAALFQRDQATISRHISKVFKDNELREAETTLKQANMQKMHTGIDKPTTYYNLDVIISVGYRVNSKRGTQFRMWATARLRDYLLKGYAISEKRLKAQHDLKLKELQETVRIFQSLLASRRAEGYEKDLLKIITEYSATWAVLNKYDKGDLRIEGVSRRPVAALDYLDLQKSIQVFKKRLLAKKEAGELFGQEVGDKFRAVLGNVIQALGGKDVYPSLEEKAAHLLYFLVKDHPFADGNKRIGSLVFMVFLVQNNAFYSLRTGEPKLSDSALSALVLLIAESRPEQKEVMVKLIVNLINRR